MSYQTGNGFDYFVHIEGDTLSGAQPAKIKQAVGIARLGKCFLLDPMNLAGGKDPAEFAFEQLAALFCQDLKNIPAQDFAARETKFTQLPIAVPGYDPIIAIDSVKR